MTSLFDNTPQYRDEAPSPLNDSLLISEQLGLYDAMDQLESCWIGFTVFAVDLNGCVTGVLTRGDVIRFLCRVRPKTTRDLADLKVKDAMIPRDGPTGKQSMLYIEQDSSETWYEQLTRLKDNNKLRWTRIKLLPVLNRTGHLVNVLDLESPRTRARLEALVMANAFPLGDPTTITNTAMALRRSDFDSIHYTTHRQKVAGLCDLLLMRTGGRYSMLDAVFDNARADEIVLSLSRAEEWLKGHVSNADMKADDQKALLDKISNARSELVERYSDAGKHNEYFPESSEKEVYEKPQIIIVLGCRGQHFLRERVSAAWQVMKQMHKPASTPILVLSGGGDGHEVTEAERMLKLLQEECDRQPGSALSSQQHKMNAATLTINGNAIDVVLEKDSRDTLGNAVFSWFSLYLYGCRYGLRTSDPNRLERMVLVTDGIHAPRSYDIFRRIFAFRSPSAGPPGPKIAVRAVERSMSLTDKGNTSLGHLRSESQVNLEIFRLVNLLTNGYDIIENGHIRSILGQMLRLHEFYKGRWDLVRKYQKCWNENDTKGNPA